MADQSGGHCLRPNRKTMRKNVVQKIRVLCANVYRRVARLVRPVYEFPRVCTLNLRIRSAKRRKRPTVLAEITTTNEFFWLRPVLRSLHEKGYFLILMSGERLYGPLRILLTREFSKPLPPVVNLCWVNAFGDLDFYLNATLSYDIKVPKRARHKVNFPHSGTSKGRDDIFSRALEQMTDVFVTGSAYLEDLMRFCHDKRIEKVPRLHKVGCPKYDGLFDHTIDKKALIEKMGLDPKLPLVFYAPTWNREASIFSWLNDVLTIPEKHDVNLVVKVHPGSYIDPTNKKSSGGVDWEAFFDDENLRKKRIFNAFNTDSLDIVMASDVTITDISTIWIEFYFLRKPIIFIDVPEFFKRFGRNSLGEFRDTYGYLVKTRDGMHSTIAGLLAGTIARRSAPSLDDRLLYNKEEGTASAIVTLERLYDSS